MLANRRMNYNMHSIGKTIAELHAMFKLHEKGIPNKAETPAVLDIRGGKIQKNNKKNLQRERERLSLHMLPSPCLTTTKRDYLIRTQSVSQLTSRCYGGEEADTMSFKGLSVGNGMRTVVEAIGSFDLLFEWTSYPKETMGYYFYNPRENKIFVTRYAELFKSNLDLQEANVEEHELGDLNKPPNYKATLSDLESDKWLDAMNAEMQSMKDNQV
ncbi:hypothetical protein Tco_1130416 [Tanacetum coccineum]